MKEVSDPKGAKHCNPCGCWSVNTDWRLPSRSITPKKFDAGFEYVCDVDDLKVFKKNRVKKVPL